MSDSKDRLYDRSFVLNFLSQTFFVLGNTLLTHYGRWIVFLGGNVRDVGEIMGAGATLGLAIRPWMGRWIDALGARTMLAVGYLLFAGVALGNLLLVDLGPAIYALRLVVVVAAAIVFASSLTYVTQASPPTRRTEAIGILGAGGFVGMLLGPALGDFFLGDAERTRQQFEMLFGAAALAMIAPTIMLFFLHPGPPRDRARAFHPMEFVRIAIRYWPGSILLVIFTFGVCMTIPFVFLAPFIDKVRTGSVTTFFLAYAGWGLFLRVWLRQLPDRIGRRKVLLAGLGFMGTGMFGYHWVSAAQPWTLFIPALCCGTGHSLMFHTMTALAIDPFPMESRGTGSTLALMTLDLGQIGGAPLLGLLAFYQGYGAVFTLVSILCAAVAVVYGLANRSGWRSEAPLPAD